MAASFGEQLRLAREARGITLRDISEQTRISTQYLEAIEKDEYAKLPGGIFNRSFIKAYARSVGFDEKEALDAYKRASQEHGDNSNDVTSTPQKFQVLTYENPTRSPLVTALLTGIVLLILSLGIYAGLHWYMKQSTPATVNNQSTPNNNANAPNQTVPVNTTTPDAPPIDPNVFVIQLKAKEEVWLIVTNDSEKTSSFKGTLAQGQVQELKPQQQVKIVLSKDKANSLEVSVNGRPIKAQFQFSGNGAFLVITKDNYQQMLAQ